jgi:hypothetical protein
MKNHLKKIIIFLIICTIIIISATILYQSTFRSAGPSPEIDSYLTTFNAVSDTNVVVFNHSSRGYSWSLSIPKRYKQLTNSTADGPYIEWGVTESGNCKISANAPAREKAAIESSDIDSVYNKFVEGQSTSLARLGKNEYFLVKKPLSINLGNLIGVMFEYNKNTHNNMTYVSKYIKENIIAAFVLECLPIPTNEKELLQYKKEFIEIIKSFK